MTQQRALQRLRDSTPPKQRHLSHRHIHPVPEIDLPPPDLLLDPEPPTPTPPALRAVPRTASSPPEPARPAPADTAERTLEGVGTPDQEADVRGRPLVFDVYYRALRDTVDKDIVAQEIGGEAPAGWRGSPGGWWTGDGGCAHRGIGRMWCSAAGARGG